jgi:hypothetical protein
MRKITHLTGTGVPRQVLPWEMVENSTSLCKSLLAGFFVNGQSEQTISPWSEAPSDLSWWLFHQLPRDMTLQPHLPSGLSSGSRQQGASEHLARRPSSGGSASGHGWSPVPIALRCPFAPSFSRLHEPHPQRFVETHEVIVRTPPLQMGEKLWGLLGSRPGMASERGYCMSDGQIHLFDTSGVQPTWEA